MTQGATAFELVPVIDLMGGLVVHARAGDRERYQPLHGSRVAAIPEPLAVVRGLLALHPFRTLYIADLDAILKRGDHKAQIRELRQTFPELRLWVDAGFAGACACRRFLAADLGDLVLGSESQGDTGLLETLSHEPRLALSLDFKGDQALGPEAVFATPALWPLRVIVMTLARVGAAAGPDLERLRAVRATAPDRAVYAAGGVRGVADIEALKAIGCAGVLLASALHDGRLDPPALARLSGVGLGS
jgi:phosphoribosylformimino-5-aminoimidazole carboxamide ribotide isomerase